MVSRKLLGIAVMVVFAIAAAAFGKGQLTSVSAACPTPNPNNTACADTTATINGTSVAPSIECKWELPVASFNGAYTGDDDGLAPVPSNACKLAVGGVGGAPANNSACYNGIALPTTIGGPVHRSIGINAPNNSSPINNPPPVRNVELWAAIDHCNGLGNVGDVYWDVYQPCPGAITGAPACVSGYALKVQVHYNSAPPAQGGPTGGACVQELDLSASGGTRNGGLACGRGVVYSGHPNYAGQSCDNGGNSALLNMFRSADNSPTTGTQQIDPPAITDTTSGLIALCAEGIKGLFSANLQIDKDEPCGEWKVVAKAVATTGATSTMTNYFNVRCNVALVTDFTTVNWNNITPGIVGNVVGDLNWGTGGPTVGNVNNSAMDVEINFSPMVGLTEGKIIDTFDAKFGRSPSSLNVCDPLAANTTYDLSVVGCSAAGTPLNRYVLCADELGKLDLSIHPVQASGGTLPNDTYKGTVTLTGSLVPGEPNICYGDYHTLSNEVPTPPPA